MNKERKVLAFLKENPVGNPHNIADCMVMLEGLILGLEEKIETLEKQVKDLDHHIYRMKHDSNK